MKTNQLFIDGQWVESASEETIEVVNPATEEVIGRVPNANHDDVDHAVFAAKQAFPAWNRTPVEERAVYLEKIANLIEKREEELLNIIIAELGTTVKGSLAGHIGRSYSEIRGLLKDIRDYPFEEQIENGMVIKEGYGVVACITPWNYPLNQIQRKVTPALLAGNTVVVKPASNTPLTGIKFAEIFEEVGLPAGVFNFITGDGSDTGDYLAEHKDVAVISFTGSTAVGKGLYEKAHQQVKKLILELGGKSAMIYLKDGNLDLAVNKTMDILLSNQGQTCSALTRLLVPSDELENTKEALQRYFEEEIVIGDPTDPEVTVGAMVSKTQQERVLDYIEKGKEEGATVFLGGEPADIDQGYYVQPTVFTDVTNDMTIAREEIFGPVLTVMTYDTVEEAIELANDSEYGLSGAVVGPHAEAVDVARQMRTGNILVNEGERNNRAPFGGYKQSGLGLEVGRYGLEDYLAVKTYFV